MKSIKNILIVILFVIIFSFSVFSASALDGGFDLEPIPSDEYYELAKEDLGEIRVLTEEPENGKFRAFALKDDGSFVLDFRTSDVPRLTRHNICVYDRNGVFQYGISFMQRLIYLNWNGDNIVVYDITHEGCAEFSPNGDLVNLGPIASTDHNYDIMFDAEKRTKTAGDFTYSEHKSSPLNAEFSTLINDDDGTVLYQAEKGNKSFSDYFIVVFIIVCALALPTVIVPVVIVNVIRKKRRKGQ